jgi:peptidoglycan hydrolase CwlO-like protein
MPDQIITAIIAGVVGLAVAIANNHFGRRKSNADAAGAITSAATALVEPLEKRVTKVENENIELKKQVKALQAENETLRGQVMHLQTENETLRGQIQRRGLAKK